LTRQNLGDDLIYPLAAMAWLLRIEDGHNISRVGGSSPPIAVVGWRIVVFSSGPPARVPSPAAATRKKRNVGRVLPIRYLMCNLRRAMGGGWVETAERPDAAKD
jgi:hypothetical protein